MIGVCVLEGCDNRDKLRRGWCATHYQRWYRNGDPMAFGHVELDAAPLVAVVERSRATISVVFTATERRTFYRARNRGTITAAFAERLLAKFGRTLDDTYGMDWDDGMGEINAAYRETMRRHTEGVNPLAVERARDGVNDRCVDCAASPLGGGLRCVECYRKVARPRGAGEVANPEPSIPFVERVA